MSWTVVMPGAGAAGRGGMIKCGVSQRSVDKVEGFRKRNMEEGVSEIAWGFQGNLTVVVFSTSSSTLHLCSRS